jgi:glyoxylase-like metal-dependent hydrolase (beta-lactamase superfamily II)
MFQVHSFFDKATFTLTYIVWDPSTKDAVVVDPVLDYDPASSRVGDESVERVVHFLNDLCLMPHYFLETHAHADHLSGAQFLKRKFPHAKIAIGAHITGVQEVFRDIFDLGPKFMADGSQFDLLLHDGQKLRAGSLEFEVLSTPGHTPACCSFRIKDAVFTGDALFMPDYGVGRCDFPAGSAETLYQSVTQKLYTLPESTRVFTGHDYMPNGRVLRFESTIGEQKRANVQLSEKTTSMEFVRFREARDRELSAPKLLFPSVQVNITAGRIPEPHRNGRSYLTIPIDLSAV